SFEPVSAVARALAKALALRCEEGVPGTRAAEDGVASSADGPTAKDTRPVAISGDPIADEEVVRIGVEGLAEPLFRRRGLVVAADRTKAIAVTVAEQPEDPQRPPR